MKFYLEKAIFLNRAPFQNLELDFSRNEISVLSASNGKGKTTIISHIVDAFYEISRPHFSQEYEGKENKLYRLSTAISNLDMRSPSYVYFRFKLDDEIVDYLDIRNRCTEDEYNNAINLENKIPFSEFQEELTNSNYIKTVSSNLTKEKVQQLFNLNLLTYFPAYRYEQPGYLNDPYKIRMDFKKFPHFSGSLNNKIEVISGLPELANRIMDVILDNQYLNIQKKDIENTLKTITIQEPINITHLPNIIDQLIHISINTRSVLRNNLNTIASKTLISKNLGNVRFGIGQRNSGGTRIQLIEADDSQQIYPSIFNLSSGESSLLCLFGELLRQADNNKTNISMSEITGIVLIDEIDKHLHIKLQKEVLPKLLALFPNVQFIVSSHSPFLSMGLASELLDRSKIIDLDGGGISKDPTNNGLYEEVYTMMINENENFKTMYESINSQINSAKSLQVITEGKNTEHLRKAISILAPSLLERINIVQGVEDRSGTQQLKNAFEIISKAQQSNKYLFVWDCDADSVVSIINESDSTKKFCFEKNSQNTKVTKGIENLYPEGLFTSDVYENISKTTEYGENNVVQRFNKGQFLGKIQLETSKQTFNKFQPLINYIEETITPPNNSDTLPPVQD